MDDYSFIIFGFNDCAHGQGRYIYHIILYLGI